MLASRRSWTLVLGPAVLSLVWITNLAGQGLHPTDRTEFADLVYDPTTGTVVISDADAAMPGDDDYRGIVAFSLGVASGSNGKISTQPRLPFVDSGSNTDATEHQLGQVLETVADQTSKGSVAFHLGSVFPVGMQHSELVSFLDVAIFARDLGNGGNLDAVLSTELETADFAANGNLDQHDIDLLCTESQHSAPSNFFDLNNDDAVEATDIEQFLELASSLSGDADVNGVVEFADFLALSSNFGAVGRYSQGDFNCSGTIDFADFLILSDNFGKKNTSIATVFVPEPGTVLPVLVAVVSVLTTSRRSVKNAAQNRR